MNPVQCPMTNDSVLWFVDGVPVKRKLDIKIVFINPFDSYGFHNSASDRREWLDYFLSQLDDNYKKNLAKYTLALRFRNTLLSKKPSKYKEQNNCLRWRAKHALKVFNCKACRIPKRD